MSAKQKGITPTVARRIDTSLEVCVQYCVLKEEATGA